MTCPPERDARRWITLLVATSNPNKLQEIRGLLGEAGIEITGLDELAAGLDAPEETGATFAENARLKALHYSALNPEGLTAAEDSGLVIDALDGEPGVQSARFVRPDASYPERFAEIYRRLDEHPERPRSARFVCALAVARHGGIVY
jgi:XTP/dITP diphosphohydrolase